MACQLINLMFAPFRFFDRKTILIEIHCQAQSRAQRNMRPSGPHEPEKLAHNRQSRDKTGQAMNTKKTAIWIPVRSLAASASVPGVDDNG
jgi:hypothetical protein